MEMVKRDLAPDLVACILKNTEVSKDQVSCLLVSCAFLFVGLVARALGSPACHRCGLCLCCMFFGVCVCVAYKLA